MGKGHVSPHFSEPGVRLDALSCLAAVDPRNRNHLGAVKVEKHHLYVSLLAVQTLFSVTKVLINLKEVLMDFLKLHCRSSRALSLAVFFFCASGYVGEKTFGI